jgi:hypothetical protein
MQVIDRKNSSVSSSAVGKNIINAGLAFTISAFTTLKPMEQEQVIPDKKQPNQFNELKIESDAYDIVRKSLH